MEFDFVGKRVMKEWAIIKYENPSEYKKAFEIKTQKEVANAADITDMTLRTRLKDLKYHLDLLN
ncbi:MAG: hypothetical protein M3044_04650 [Thermoproteota archaeon]|nr:hypothetical protein [Thermoproteota archaeon]